MWTYFQHRGRVQPNRSPKQTLPKTCPRANMCVSPLSLPIGSIMLEARTRDAPRQLTSRAVNGRLRQIHRSLATHSETSEITTHDLSMESRRESQRLYPQVEGNNRSRHLNCYVAQAEATSTLRPQTVGQFLINGTMAASAT